MFGCWMIPDSLLFLYIRSYFSTKYINLQNSKICFKCDKGFKFNLLLQVSIVHDYIPLLFGLSDVQISMLCDDDGIGNVVLML